MGRSQPALFDALQHRVFCLDPFKRSAVSVCILFIFYLLCMLRCPARVFDDMISLCRKYCPRQLSEIEGSLNVSAAHSVVDGEELEYEDADIQTSLETAAAEMGLGKDGLVEELGKTDEEEQPPAEDMHNEEMLGLKSNPEPMNVEPIQEVHGNEAQEVVHGKSDTAVEQDQTKSIQEAQIVH